jgi:hypothetical protein
MGAMMAQTARLTDLVGEIDLAGEPAPFVMSDGMAAAILARRTSAPYDPERRLADAEAQAGRRLLLRDRLSALRERRQITAAEARAGREIEIMEMRATAIDSPSVRTQLRERLASSTGHSLEDLWLLLMEAEVTRYGPWRDWAMAFPVQRRGQATMETLTRMVCTQGLGLGQVSDKLGQDVRRTSALLRRSLHRYATLGGWQEGDNPPPIEAA